MRILKISPKEVREKRASRTATYWLHIAPAIVEWLPDGGLRVNADHPAYRHVKNNLPTYIPAGGGRIPPRQQTRNAGFRGRTAFEQGGSDNWARLHRSKPDPKFFEQWKRSIPCGSCKEGLKKIVAQIPPDFSSDEAWFKTGWAWHNAVNQHLGKSIIPLEEARRLWRGIPTMQRQKETQSLIGGAENRYLNKACFLVACGPSMAKVNLEAMRQPGVMLFGINNSPAIIRPHLWTCGDRPDNFLASIWLDPAITKFCPTDRLTGKLYDSVRRIPLDLTPRDCANVTAYAKGDDLNADGSNYLTTDKVIWGRAGKHRCVMLLAIRLAYAMGFARVYLLGVDWNMTGGKQYAFDEAKDARAQQHNNALYDGAGESLRLVRPHLEAGGMQILNATSGSKLTAFDAVAFDEAVEECRAINLEGIDPAAERTRGMYK